MPWCEACSRFLSPATLTADGRCPTCGRRVDPGRAHAATGPAAPPVHADDSSVGSGEPATRDGLPPIPWHFKLLCGAASIYLGWRAIQGIDWIAGRF
jgi:hypothetical protein